VLDSKTNDPSNPSPNTFVNYFFFGVIVECFNGIECLNGNDQPNTTGGGAAKEGNTFQGFIYTTYNKSVWIHNCNVGGSFFNLQIGNDQHPASDDFVNDQDTYIGQGGGGNTQQTLGCFEILWGNVRANRCIAQDKDLAIFTGPVIYGGGQQWMRSWGQAERIQQSRCANPSFMPPGTIIYVKDSSDPSLKIRICDNAVWVRTQNRARISDNQSSQFHQCERLGVLPEAVTECRILDIRPLRV